ncbi:hypothetical protein [Streptomyces glomeratus]|uniref:SnoaL-like domain-containing protein n=1 Tax=Streptomyces glomeratus TaxID=284452 RepID=A0ABP6M4Z3_9ACTN|nr:hypothetical protein [Streptomyces glomeratus]MCF1510435.1 hypothetical protein [Streptomyces glomeratus]
MTATPRSPRLLLLSTITLAVAGVALLRMPHGQAPSAPATSSTVHTATEPSPASEPFAGTPPTGTAASTPAASTPAGLKSALPPHGEGTAGDTAIQQALQAAWPPDLPARDERELLAAGRGLLRADATGIGRARWPGVFPTSRGGLAPAFATAQFRIQAAIARRDGAKDHAVVHLVWAGADRGGTFTDGRITDWRFTRTTTRKGASTWTPQPRT